MMVADTRATQRLARLLCLLLLNLAGCAQPSRPAPASAAQPSTPAAAGGGERAAPDLLALRDELQGMLDAVEQRLLLELRRGSAADEQLCRARAEQRLSLSVALARVERIILRQKKGSHGPGRRSRAGQDLPATPAAHIAEAREQIELVRRWQEPELPSDESGEHLLRPDLGLGLLGRAAGDQTVYAAPLSLLEDERPPEKTAEAAPDVPRRPAFGRDLQMDFESEGIPPLTPPPGAPGPRPSGRRAAQVDAGAAAVDLGPYINQRLPRLQACFPPDRLTDGVQLLIRARLGGGLLRELRVQSSSPLPAAVKGCLIAALQGLRVPATGGSQLVTIPLWLGAAE